MAHIGPTAMLVGKSVPRLTGAMLVLFAQFPFTLLAVTLGGVLRHQIVAGYTTLLAYLVLVAGLGLIFSVLCRTSMAAARGVVIVLGIFLILPPIVDDAFRSGPSLVTRASPFIRIEEICRTGFTGATPVAPARVRVNGC